MVIVNTVVLVQSRFGLGAAEVAWALAAFGFGSMAAALALPRLLDRLADRPAIFAAQFALSHACWLLCYPLAGWLGAGIGLGSTFLVMALIGLAGVILARRLWPAEDADEVLHAHPDLPPDHPHLRMHGTAGQHRHVIVADALHPRPAS